MAVAPYPTVLRANAAEDDRRFGRSSLYVVLVAVLLLVVGVGFKAYRFTLPTEGWSLRLDFERGLIFDRNLLGEASPFQEGDILLSVAGESLQGDFLTDHDPRVREIYRVGNTVPYTIERDGRTLAFDVPLHRWTARGVAGASGQIFSNRVFQFSPFLFLQLAIALFVFSQRPNNRAAQVLLLLSVAGLVSGISWVGSVMAPADTFDPVARVSSYLLGAAINPLLSVPLFLHLALVFPKPKWGFDTSWWPVVGLYGLPWLAYALRDFQVLPGIPADILVPGYFFISLIAFGYSLVTIKEPEARAQMKWVAYGGAFYALASLIWVSSAILAWLPPSVASIQHWLPVDLLLVACLAVAILKYHLFDIDVIINRTLVYSGLSAGVVGLYVLVVGGLGSLLQPRGTVGVPLVATALIAVAFNPLRNHLQRGVNRLLYGERDDPFAVLSKLSRKLEGTLEPSKVLPAITETVAQVLNLPYAGVVLTQGDAAELVASYGQRHADLISLPLTYQGETIGELRLEPRPGEAFRPAELSLLTTIAQQASVAGYALRQSLALQRSREALVTTREEERLRIRRDLHDGLGPELAGIAMKLDAARNLLAKQPLQADGLLLELKSQTQDAIADIRRLVYDLRPPALDQLGLGEALREQLTTYAGELHVELRLPTPLPPLPAAVEVALYRIAQEALTNVHRHAKARTCLITLELGNALTLSIEDDGVGLPAEYRAGVGLRSMRERAEELGGTFWTIRLEALGTRVTASLPLSAS